MRAIERFAIDEMGVPSLELMERAGSGCGARRRARRARRSGVRGVREGQQRWRRLRRRAGAARGRPSRAGARHRRRALGVLRRRAREPRAPARGAAGAARGSAAGRDLGGRGRVCSGPVSKASPGAPSRRRSAAINAAPAAVVSVDVPSGVDASTGAVAAEAVRANVTTSFELAKPGLWIAPGKEHAGEVRVVDIGIPREARTAAAIRARACSRPDRAHGARRSCPVAEPPRRSSRAAT